MSSSKPAPLSEITCLFLDLFIPLIVVKRGLQERRAVHFSGAGEHEGSLQWGAGCLHAFGKSDLGNVAPSFCTLVSSFVKWSWQ